MKWFSPDLTDQKSTLIQEMAWCHQATSHYLNQCWSKFLQPYGVTRPQWVINVLSEMHLFSCFTMLKARGKISYQFMSWIGIKDLESNWKWKSSPTRVDRFNKLLSSSTPVCAMNRYNPNTESGKTLCQALIFSIKKDQWIWIQTYISITTSPTCLVLENVYGADCNSCQKLQSVSVNQDANISTIRVRQ